MPDLKDNNSIKFHGINYAVITDTHFSMSNQALPQRTACFDRIDQESFFESGSYSILEVLRYVLDIFGYEGMVEKPINHCLFHNFLWESAFFAENVFSLSTAISVQKASSVSAIASLIRSLALMEIEVLSRRASRFRLWYKDSSITTLIRGFFVGIFKP
ncbi:MAG: hypothetical protein WAU81_12665 [Candidatus Aminicenantales bacterium]